VGKFVFFVGIDDVCFKCVVWFGDVLMFECNVEIVCGLVGCGKVKVIVDG